MGRRWALLVGGLLVGSLFVGCGQRPAVHLVLTPDPAVTPLDTLLARLDHLQVVVDAQDGLRGIDESGPRDDGSTAQDWDGDGLLEVVFTAEALGVELPILEIGLGDNAGQTLEFQVLGYAGVMGAPGEAVALGGVTANCPEGEQTEVGVPFNLRAWARPPQVVQVLPPDGGSTNDLRSALVLLSTTVEESSVSAGVQVVGPDQQVVPIDVQVETVYAAEDESSALLTLVFADDLEQGEVQIQVGPGIISTAGERFDQDPSTPAEDAFFSSFQHEVGAWGFGSCDECPQGYLCDEAQTGCVPALDCSFGCGAGFVCEPDANVCVEDCRTFAACTAPQATCDELTGLCR